MASGVSNDSGKSLTQWLRENGFDEETLARMSRRCKNLQSLDAGEALGVWDYLLTSVKIERRKLRHVVAKCPGRSRRPSPSSRRCCSTAWRKSFARSSPSSRHSASPRSSSPSCSWSTCASSAIARGQVLPDGRLLCRPRR
jgi:hypothetical protein